MEEKQRYVRRFTRTIADRILAAKEMTGGTTLSQDLLSSGYQLVGQCLFDRKVTFRTKENHYSPNAPAVIILFYTALESFINEVIQNATLFESNQELIECIGKDIFSKAQALNVEDSLVEKADILTSIRNEVIHYYIGVAGKNELLNDWYTKNGMVMHERLMGYPFQTYKVAFWVIRAVNEIAVEIISKRPPTTPLLSLKDNFVLPNEVVLPENLSAYDQAFNLKLTVVGGNK